MLKNLWAGAVQYPGLAGQEQRSNPGVCGAADGRRQRTTRVTILQRT